MEGNPNYKILIVDDEPDIVELVGYNLKKEGYQVFEASNGAAALQLMETVKPHLVILDIMMPEMDGVELCRHIRNKAEFADVLVAFLTARNEDYSQIAALDVGGDDFITKPIRPRVLLSRIKALLRRFERTNGKEEPEDSMNLGGLKINKENVNIELNGEVIDLAKKEFELLSLLASKPGKVFTREEIFHKIWGTDVIVGNRTIDVHIRKLREKIGDSFIKTVKGIGYKFEF